MWLFHEKCHSSPLSLFVSNLAHTSICYCNNAISILVAAILFKIEIDYIIRYTRSTLRDIVSLHYYQNQNLDIIHCILPIKKNGMKEVDCNIFENVVYILPTSKISQPSEAYPAGGCSGCWSTPLSLRLIA